MYFFFFFKFTNFFYLSALSYFLKNPLHFMVGEYDFYCRKNHHHFLLMSQPVSPNIFFPLKIMPLEERPHQNGTNIPNHHTWPMQATLAGSHHCYIKTSLSTFHTPTPTSLSWVYLLRFMIPLLLCLLQGFSKP